MTTIYSALYQDGAHLDCFGKVKTVYHPAQLQDVDSILILHGGSDISPSIYNQKPSVKTQANELLSPRDLSEILLARRAIELGIPIFGICRGAQLSCALAGGTLIQHVDGHVGISKHKVTTSDNKVLTTTTCHHQMMNPFGIKHELLAWSTDSLSNRYIVENEQQVEMPCEPEVVFFPEIRALGIQGHPEWMNKQDSFIKYCLDLVKEKLLCNSTTSTR